MKVTRVNRFTALACHFWGMSMDPIHGLDWGTYYFFRSQRMGGAFDLNIVMLVGTKLGSYLALGLLAFLVLLVLWRRAGALAAAAFVIVTATAVGLGEGLKRVVHRPRPQDAELWLSQSELPFSFPSTSALLSSFLVLVLAMIWGGIVPERGRRIAGYGIGVAFVLFIGISQLYLGVHFVTDLVAGWTAGILLGLILAGFLAGVPLVNLKCAYRRYPLSRIRHDTIRASPGDRGTHFGDERSSRSAQDTGNNN